MLLGGVPMIAHERRRSARNRRRYGVALGRVSSFTVDVCPSGFCAEAVRPLRPGSDVEGSMHVSGRWVAFGGQVAWSKSGSATVGGKVGVRFTRIPWDLQRLLG